MFLEIINTYGAQLLGTLLVTLFGIFGMALRKLAAGYLDTDTKRTLAKIVVQFVEQTCKTLHGKEKLNAALTTLSELLAQKHITATVSEMRILLESAVAEFNQVFHKNPTPTAN